MLPEEELRERLLASAELAALVGARVFGGRAAQNADLPHVVWKRISGSEDHALDGPSGLVRGRFSIDCYALTYEASVAVGSAVAAAAQINSPTLELYLDARQDFYEDETPKRFRRALDFTTLEVPFDAGLPVGTGAIPLALPAAAGAGVAAPLPPAGTGAVALSGPAVDGLGQAIAPGAGVSISGTARLGQTITVTNGTGLSCFVQVRAPGTIGYDSEWLDLDLDQPEPALTLGWKHLGHEIRVRAMEVDGDGVPTGFYLVSNVLGPVLHDVEPATLPGAVVVATAPEFAAAASAGAPVIVLAAGTIWSASDFPNTYAAGRITTPGANPAIVRNSSLKPSNWDTVQFDNVLFHQTRDWLAVPGNRDHAFEPLSGCSNLVLLGLKVLGDDVPASEYLAVPPTLLQSPYRNTGRLPNPPGPAYEANGTSGMRFVAEGLNLSNVTSVVLEGYFARNVNRALFARVGHQIRDITVDCYYFDSLLLQDGTGSGSCVGYYPSRPLGLYDERDANNNSFGSGNTPHTDAVQLQGGSPLSEYVFDKMAFLMGNTRAMGDGLPGNPVLTNIIANNRMFNTRFRRMLWSGEGSINTYLSGADVQVDYTTKLGWSAEGTCSARFNGSSTTGYAREGRFSRSLLDGPIITSLLGPDAYLTEKAVEKGLKAAGLVASRVYGDIARRAMSLAEQALLARPRPGWEGLGALSATGHWRSLGPLPAPPAITTLVGTAGGFSATLAAVAGATEYRLRYRIEGATTPLTVLTSAGTSFAPTGLTPGATYEVAVWVETPDGLSIWSNPVTVTAL